ncbi:hypothetical protein LBMAG43_07090 [Methylococcaceae bacterium]|nr:hypothetical protein LBMAG43_07090 [Methylococcaceae bacterium]
MFNSKNTFKLSIISSLLLSTSAFALEKPKSIDDMWKIIEAQQKQIEALQQTKSLPEEIPTKSPNSEVKTLERKTDILSQEVEKLRTNLSIPEEAQYKSAYGLGPAASKVYQVGKGLSIGGYGEANYRNVVSDKTSKDSADMYRVVLYAGYKFTDKMLFNSEIEFEHGSTDYEGQVSVEFAALDFFINPLANIRAGMVLVPMGFINQIHEPPFYFGNNRPEVERRIIPSTWSEMGVGLFGQITPELTYTTYVVNGLNAQGFGSGGIRSGRQGGSEATAENFGYVARLDYTPTYLTGVTLGASGYVGDSGQDGDFGGQKVNAFTQLYEGHVQWKYRGLEWRTLGSVGRVDDAGILSAAKGQAIGSESYGFYTEVGYDILPHIIKNTDQYLAPFFRYEQYDTLAKVPVGYADNENLDRQIYQVGLQYKPIPNVVIKADYRNFVAKKGIVADDFNLGFGFIF